MIFELLHAPFPAGYTETLLPLDDCKEACSVLNTDDDALIALFRDAAIEFVERFNAVRLGPITGLIWQADCFPASAGIPLVLGVSPVTQITAIGWKDSDGTAVTGTVGDFRIAQHGTVLPAIGGDGWPTDVGGEVEITFDAGYEADEAPAHLIQAAKMFTAFLYLNREGSVSGQQTEYVPPGVLALLNRSRRISV